MHAVLIGASRGIGYLVLLSLLNQPILGPRDDISSFTLLLRNPDAMEADDKVAAFVKGGRVRLVKGDAKKEEDVRRCFEGEKVDVVVSSIGAAGTPSLKGIQMDQPDLCTRGALALLHVMAELQDRGVSLPRLVLVSSMGMGENHHDMPKSMQYFYSMVLTKPHRDKVALEYLLQRASSVLTLPTGQLSIPDPSILPNGAFRSVRPDFIPEMIVVRPAFFSADAEARPKDKVKVGEKVAVYTVKRSEVARFIVEDCVKSDQWLNKFPVIGSGTKTW